VENTNRHLVELSNSISGNPALRKKAVISEPVY
jgi:hypothetical protein